MSTWFLCWNILKCITEAHTDGLVNEAAALLKAALEPRAPAEVEKFMDWSFSTNRFKLIQNTSTYRRMMKRSGKMGYG